MNLKSTLLILSFTLLFIGVVSAFNEKERAIAKLDEALRENDVKALMELVTSSDQALEIDETNIRILIEYISSENEIDFIINRLQKQMDDDLFVMKEKKKWGVLKTYYFELQPYYVRLYLPDGTKTITLTNGKVIDVNEKEQLVLPIVPGRHEWKAAFQTPYTSYENRQTMTLLPSDANYQREIKRGITTAEKVKVHGMANGELFLNGVSVGELKKSVMTLSHVPIDGSVSIYMKKELPWGTFYTNEIGITDREISLTFDPVNKKVEVGIIQAARSFMESVEAAFNERDADLLKRASLNAKAQFTKFLKEEVGEHPDLLRDYIISTKLSGYRYTSLGEFEGYLNVDEDYVWKNVPYSMWKDYKFIYDEQTESWVVDGWNWIYNHRGRAIYEATGTLVYLK